MPPLGSAGQRPLGIYTALMIISAAFLALAALVTYSELSSDYDFMGSAQGFEVEEPEEE